MILPFAVLFGSMATFVDLTRKLELIVARAAGMSVWQFIAPPALTALLIGVVSVAIYNPFSASMKQRSEQMEWDLFGVPGSLRIDHGVWLRQHGVDGLAIMHAMNSSNGGSESRGQRQHRGARRFRSVGYARDRARSWLETQSPARAGAASVRHRPDARAGGGATTPPQGTPFYRCRK
jgi:lipopolysaccharide export system permease protein